jgi:hypothetical protein
VRRRTLIPIGSLAAVLLAVPALPAHAAAPGISGTVTLGGTARAGVPVSVSEPGGDPLAEARTDAAGRYALPAPAAGTRYIVSVNVRDAATRPRAAVAGYLPTWTGAGPDAVPAAALVEPATATGADRALDVAVPAATRVRGANAAFAKREVRLVTLGGRETATTTADAKGAWSFLVAPGSYRIEVFGTVRWLDYRSRAFTVPGGETVVVRSSPVRSGTITGRLTWRGKPVGKVHVWLQGPTRSEEPDDDPVVTDAKGRYRFAGLKPGRFTVRFGNTGEASDRIPYLPAKRERTVRSGRTTVVDAALVRSAVLDGRFDAPSGAKRYVVQIRRGGATGPLVRTTSLPASTRTTKNPVRAAGLRGGTYTVQVVDTARGTKAAVRTVRLRTGVRTAIGVLRPTKATLTVSGTVPAGAAVRVSEGSFWRTTTADGDGRYTIRGVVPGRYEVTAQVRGHEAVTAKRTVTRSTVVDLPIGAAPDVRSGVVTGRFTAGALDVPLAGLTVDGGQELLVRDGRLNEHLSAGAHRFTAVQVLGDRLFPVATPYDLALRDEDRAFTVPDGGTVDLGTVALDVLG